MSRENSSIKAVQTILAYTAGGAVSGMTVGIVVGNCIVQPILVGTTVGESQRDNALLIAARVVPAVGGAIGAGMGFFKGLKAAACGYYQNTNDNEVVNSNNSYRNNINSAV